MTSSNRRRAVLLVALATATAAFTAGVSAQSSEEEIARRTLDSGRAFLRSENYVEAVRDFTTLLERYPATTVADDALLELAVYELQVARNPAGAESHANALLKRYPTSDSAPMAQVVLGRVKLAHGLSPDQLDAAVAEFDRVARLYPGTEAVPASMYFGAEAARLAGDRDEAIGRFTQLATEFPNSIWTADALIGSALSLTAAGQPLRAMEGLQRIRSRFPNTPQAARAMQLNSVLYRLYVRTPVQPTFQFSGRTVPSAPAKLKDVADIAVRGDTLLVAAKGGISTYGSKGTSTVAAPEPRSLLFDRAGRMVTVHELGLRENGGALITLTLPAPPGKRREMKLVEALATQAGDLLVADAEEKTIFRFGRDARYLGDFAAPIQVRRMAISDLDDVAVLHGNTKAVTLFDRTGRAARQIAERGTGYQLRNPVDVAFDAFGHLYVLDRTAVLVFSPDASKLLATFTTPERTPGAIGQGAALALDAAGRLYVMDARTDSVKVYR